MPAIRKDTKRAKEIIQNARNIRGYSLANNFSGTPLANECNIWGGPVVNGRYRDLLSVSQQEFLAHELNASRSTKLYQNGDGRYTIHVHSNLWFEFEV